MSTTKTRAAGVSARLMAGAGLAALCLASAAHAQSTAPDTQKPADNSVDEVVVTGFRSALRNAIQQKRSSDQIVESISSEDIGKLPDNSIAESIARLPGLTAQRLDGRDSVISIRGLAPDFSTTLLNGREQVSTGDNRAAEFDQYPSELISGVVVYKTPEAGLVGQGLSGTVDLHTIRPLDYKTRVVSLNARGEVDTLNSRSDQGYRVSGTYVDQFANGTLGLSVGIAHEESPNVSDRYRIWGYSNPPGSTALLPGGGVFAAYYGQLQRTGISVTGQYRPNNKFSSTLDLYYSDYHNSQDYHGYEGALAYGATLNPGYTIAGGQVTSGTFSNYQFVGRNDLNSRQANLYSLGYNAVYEDGPWKYVGDVSFSGVRRRDKILETYSGTGRPGLGASDTMAFTYDADGDVTIRDSLNRGDASLIKLTSPQGWGGDVVPGGQDGYLNAPLVRDELQAYRGSAVRQVRDGSFIKSLEIGANFTRRFKSYTPDEYFLGLKANAADPTHTPSVPFPASVLGSNASLAFVGDGQVLNADPEALLASGLYNFIRNPNADVATKGWKVEENVASAWFKAAIDQAVPGGDVTGNVGVQVVYTDQSSTGAAASGAPIILRTTVKSGDHYVEPLPSINLNYRLMTGDVVRLGLARTLARPRMDQLSASVNYGYNSSNAAQTSLSMSPFSGGGGNPKLHPWIADSADLSFEHYFGKDAYISVAAYYKYLETYVYTQSLLYDFSSYPIPPGPSPVLKQGFVNIPNNGTGGDLYGVEFSVTLPLTLLTQHVGIGPGGWLDGFGLSGSASYTESTIQPDPSNPATPLPGLSKYVGNGTLFYEKNGLSARISVRYRSKYLAEVSGFGDSRTTTAASPEAVVDTQVGYEWKTGRLKGLTVLVQGNNLTNEPFHTYYNGDPRQTEYNQVYGRRILFGVSYKY
jgi:iron complex outermembrane receptor protein